METVKERPDLPERHYLEVLDQITREAVQGLTPGERLTRLVELIAGALQWDVCSMYILDREKQTLVLAATHGLDPAAVGKVVLPLSEGLVGAAAEMEEPIFVKVAAEDPRYRYFPETKEEEMASMAAVPMVHRGKVTGVLTVQTREPYDFTTTDRQFLQVIAGQLGQAVDVALSLRTLHGAGRRVFLGQGVSSGIAAARVHVFTSSPERIVVAARGFRGVEFETDLFQKTLDAAIAEVRGLREQIEKNSESAGKIFLAHELILQDEEFRGRVLELIQNKKESAPRAVAEVMNQFIDRFSRLDNPLLREKAQDLKGLRDQLLELMMDKKITHFAPEFEEENMVVVARDLTPQETVRLDTAKVVAIVTETGGDYSHAAILARALRLPAVVGVSGIVEHLKPEDSVLVDGDRGTVILNPARDEISAYEERRSEIQQRRERIREAASEGKSLLGSQVALDVNIGLPVEAEAALGEGLRSVGLLRTEFFYMQHSTWPNDEVHIRFYEELFGKFCPGPVTVRLLDVGGDKKVASLIGEEEEYGALGLRSVRLLLDRPEILRSQIRAIHEAAKRTRCRPRILVPMVTHPWELEAVREEMMKVTEGAEYPLGMMIEVPAALFQVEELAREADFVSIGTNDLAQYLMAADRSIARITALANPFHPAFLRALAHLFRSLAGLGKRFSICGEIAGDPVSCTALLAIGYRKFSVSPSRIWTVRYLVNHLPSKVVALLRTPLLQADTSRKTERLIRNILRQYAPLVFE
ncbi:MAG: phosphoenolpyruvate--protein phosphotransferase [Candidatus Hydrogenedentota bacterium]|nr:MAG: phosphoenolpyruvate--protein phosphotransferase [Candidatus Hydrogenedentota bacterium]